MIIAFAIVTADGDGLIKVKPVFPQDRFPAFTEFDYENGKVTGWKKGVALKDYECFEFGRIPNVEAVRWDAREVVFKKLPPKELAKIATTTSDEVYEVCLALEKVKLSDSPFEKGFVPSMAGIAATKGIFTAKQERSVFNLLYKYRKQLPELYSRHQHHPHCQKHEFKKDELKR